MQLKELLSDDRAVSPVIGVILMVAITVILAAVIGTFVLGLGDSVQSAPQAQLSFNFNDASDDGFGGAADDYVNITHESGERLDASELTVSGDGAATLNTITAFSGDVTVGDTAEFNQVNAGETIRVIWSPQDSDTQQTIGRATAPN